ncbi:DUF3575 domain-containing protein [Parabacteroides sp.]
MKYRLITLITFLLVCASFHTLRGQRLAVKTNGLAWATTTPNLGFEAALSERYTLQIFGSYNPFTLKENHKLKHWLVQPELRWWARQAFRGHFVGLHVIGGEFNAGGIKLPFDLLSDLATYRYEGGGFGGGLSYGYQWRLGKRWGVEASVGFGYARLNYDKYPCEKCGEKIGEEKKNYWGPTKAAISIIYTIK